MKNFRDTHGQYNDLEPHISVTGEGVMWTERLMLPDYFSWLLSGHLLLLLLEERHTTYLKLSRQGVLPTFSYTPEHWFPLCFEQQIIISSQQFSNATTHPSDQTFNWKHYLKHCYGLVKQMFNSPQPRSPLGICKQQPGNHSSCCKGTMISSTPSLPLDFLVAV